MSIAINFVDDDDEPGPVTFSEAEMKGHRKFDLILPIIVPAVKACYRLWDPVTVRISFSTYHDYFLCCMNAALYLYQIRARGVELTIDDVLELDEAVPRFAAIVAILDAAVQRCHEVYTANLVGEPEFYFVITDLLYLTASKVYAIGRQDPDTISSFGDAQLIAFNPAEKSCFPHAEYVLDLIISPLSECYNHFEPFHTGVDEATFLARFFRSIDVAAETYYRQRGRSEVHTSDWAAIDLPHIKETLPLFLTCFEKCRAVWTVVDFDHATYVRMVADYIRIIGVKMYRNG